MGKSTVAAMFAGNGVPVFDADAEVRRMQGPDGALLPVIEKAFPGATGPEGVKRRELGAIVFNDPDALARLEAIIHPAVRAAREQFLAEHSDAPLVLFDIPLLFEKTNVDDVDRIVVVSAPPDVQRERVLSRPDMTPEKFASILALQMPDPEKRARADFVIDTGCSLEETSRSVAALVQNLTSQLR